MIMNAADEATRWAEARDLISRYGDDLPKVYAAACMKLAEVADWNGIGRWVDLLHRCQHLRHSPPVIPFAPIALAKAGLTDEVSSPFD